MRKQKFSIIILVLTGIITLLGSVYLSYAEPRSYTLVCQGGGKMYAAYLRGMGYVINLAINFKKSPFAASQHPPGPGQCAWIDRPLRQDEPDELVFISDNQYISQIDIFPLGKYRNIRIKGDDLKYLLYAVVYGRKFYVRCYNNGKGKLIITHVGP